jgi:histidine triad (HIT) family protein
MQDCIFCRIIRGELPATRIHEDNDAIVFMDIGPVVKGHLLVIPKEHYANLEETPAAVLAKLIALVQKIAAAQKKALRTDGVNIMQSNGRAAGQVVDHIHFHVIPRFLSDGHHWNWKAQKYADSGEMQALADKIKGILSGASSQQSG